MRVASSSGGGGSVLSPALVRAGNPSPLPHYILTLRRDRSPTALTGSAVAEVMAVRVFFSVGLLRQWVRTGGRPDGRQGDAQDEGEDEADQGGQACLGGQAVEHVPGDGERPERAGVRRVRERQRREESAGRWPLQFTLSFPFLALSPSWTPPKMGRGAAATKATVAPAPPITEATRAAVLNKIEDQRACLEARGEERGRETERRSAPHGARHRSTSRSPFHPLSLSLSLFSTHSRGPHRRHLRRAGYLHRGRPGAAGGGGGPVPGGGKE